MDSQHAFAESETSPPVQPKPLSRLAQKYAGFYNPNRDLAARPAVEKPYTNATQRSRNARRRTKKLCHDCPKPTTGLSRCPECRARKAAQPPALQMLCPTCSAGFTPKNSQMVYCCRSCQTKGNRRQRMDKIDAGQCIQGGCIQEHARGNQLCAKHRDATRTRQRLARE